MQRRMLAVATLAALSVAGPVAAAQGAASKSKVTQGVVYGAVTSQGYPVTIKLSKTGRKVVRATIGLDLKCQIPPDITLPDDVKDISVSAAGKFTAEQRRSASPRPATRPRASLRSRSRSRPSSRARSTRPGHASRAPGSARS